MDPITRKLVETVRQITEGTSQNSGLVKKLPAIEGKPDTHQSLHVNDGQHYVVSSNADETLVFPSDKHGNITSYSEVHVGNPPQHGEKGFSITDHHAETFQDFVKSTGNTSGGNQTESQPEAGSASLQQTTPHQYGIGSMIGPYNKTMNEGTLSRTVTPEQQDVMMQHRAAREHLEDIETKRARAEARRSNPVTDEEVARLVQSRLSAAGGVMTRRENAVNPYNLPRPGNDGY